jgi:hypothetical protein
VTPLEQILDLARWAPSGDNTQPWRFVVVGPNRVAVLGRDTREHCVYDLDGHASQISIGALLETMSLAATRFGLEAEISRRDASREDHPVFDVVFQPNAGVREDPLVSFIETRCVQRRPMHWRSLTRDEKGGFENAVAPNFSLRWFEGWTGRARIAWFNFASAKIRLTIPEAYTVHNAVIEWDCITSENRIPSAALGASRATLAMMRWAMKTWQRVDFLNRYFAGTLTPRIELDLIPSLACAAHCVLLAREPPSTPDDYVTAGRALQRLWLTSAKLGLQLQPEYTPLVFARYARENADFTSMPAAIRQADRIRFAADRLLGAEDARRAAFMCRVGAGSPAHARSLRLPLERLLKRSIE